MKARREEKDGKSTTPHIDPNDDVFLFANSFPFSRFPPQIALNVSCAFPVFFDLRQPLKFSFFIFLSFSFFPFSYFPFLAVVL